MRSGWCNDWVTHFTYLVKLLITGRDAKEKVYRQCFSSKMTYCTDHHLSCSNYHWIHSQFIHIHHTTQWAGAHTGFCYVSVYVSLHFMNVHSPEPINKSFPTATKLIQTPTHTHTHRLSLSIITILYTSTINTQGKQIYLIFGCLHHKYIV